MPSVILIIQPSSTQHIPTSRSIPSRRAGLRAHADLGERVADAVGGGEVFLLAGFGPQVDQELHQLAGQVVAAGGLFLRRLAEQAQRGGQFAEHRRCRGAGRRASPASACPGLRASRRRRTCSSARTSSKSVPMPPPVLKSSSMSSRKRLRCSATAASSGFRFSDLADSEPPHPLPLSRSEPGAVASPCFRVAGAASE